MKPIFWISDKKANLWLECSKKFDTVQTLSDSKTKKGGEKVESAIVQIVNCRKDNEVQVHCWYVDANSKSFCMNTVVKYEKNRSYSICFDASKCTIGNKEFLLVSDPTDDYAEFFSPDESIKVTTNIPLKRAKKEFKEFLKAGLVEKHYDNWLKKTGVVCKACQDKNEPVKWLSTIVYGRVFETNDTLETIKFKNFEDSFVFNNKVFKKIREKDWFTTKYWNEKEYREVAKRYYDCSLIENRETGEIDKDNLEKWKRNWPPFEKTKKYYRDNKTGEVFNEQVRPELEPVTTKGWYTEPHFGSIECPVCKRVHQIISSYSKWTNPKAVLVEKIKKFVQVN